MDNPLRNLGAGLLRGTTADVLGMPVDTLNMLRQAMASPAAGGNPYARKIAGLLGPVMETGTSDYFAQQMGLPQGQGLLYEGARMVSPSPADLMSMARRVPIQELITYHGTPHRFEPTPANPLGEFDASKIGTGEGAQMRGYGIYLAESPGTAKAYAVNLGSKEADAINNAISRVINFNSGDSSRARDALILEGFPSEKITPEIEKTVRKIISNTDQQGNPNSLAIAGYNELKKYVPETGVFYTADLPDEMIDRMMDWDKPISEQSDYIKRVIKENELDYVPDSATGGRLIEELNKAFDPEVVSRHLRQAGIPGIKYLDQGSRDKGKGTRNFVVFPGEEKKVKILKRE